MQSFTDRLLREKELVNSTSNHSRIRDSFRTLMEDRWGRANRHTMATVEYYKVKAPLLRDPSAPHDQMDNFGTREAERIAHKLQRVRPAKADVGLVVRKYSPLNLKDVKQPWGW